MKKIILMIVVSLMMVGMVSAATLNVIPAGLDVKTSAISEWATDNSAHLKTTGTVGDGDEARIVINASDVGITTLSDLNTISWDANVIGGYLPHVDIRLDLNNNGVYDSGVDDALVFEYAKATVANCDNAPYPTGELTTFGGKGNIGDATYAWLTSAAAGPCSGGPNFFWHSLADWKLGQTNQNGKDISGSTKVLGFELEVDNWISQSESYVDNININGITYYGLIQAAITAAIAGDTINVAAGTYIEDLSIPTGKDNLVLTGVDKATTTIKGVANVPVASGNLAVPNIDIQADGVKIHGFTIEGPDYVAGKYASGLLIDGINVEIYDNNFVATAAEAEAELAHALMTYSNTGLVSGSADVSGLNVHDNTFTGSGAIGLEAIYINPHDGTGIVTIDNNQFSGSINIGITVESGNAVVTSNTVDTNLDTETAPYGTYGIRFFDSTYEGTFDSITISDNDVQHFKRGIRIGNGENNGGLSTTVITATISSNTLTNNAVGIWARQYGAVVTATSNSIAENTVGIQNDGSTSVNAENNWWGSVNPDFTSILSGSVDYRPWYIDSAKTRLNEEVTSCSPGDTEEATCGTDVGECVVGTKTKVCSADGSWGTWSSCGGTGYVAPITEVCDDGSDNDCDGYTDSFDSDCAETPDYYTRTDLVSTVDTKGAGLIGFFREVYSLGWDTVDNVQDALNWLYSNTLKPTDSFTESAGSAATVSGTYDALDIQLKEGSVGENDIATDAVTQPKIKQGAVGDSEIQTNAVKAEELADNAVDTAAIQDGAVTDAKVADTITASNYLPLAGGTLTGDLNIGAGLGDLGNGVPDLEVAGQAVFTRDGATSFRLRGKDYSGTNVESYAGVFYNNDYDQTGGTGAKKTRVIYGSNEDMDLELQGSNHIRLTAVDDNVGTGRIRLAAEDEIQVHTKVAAETDATKYLLFSTVEDVQGADPTIETNAGNLALIPAGGSVDVTGSLSVTGTVDGVDVGQLKTNYDTFAATKGVENGLATLDAIGKIPSAQLSALAITNTDVVADIAARDALSVEEGDVAIVTDAGAGKSKSYIYDGVNWQELKTPTDAVDSVNGQTGNVILSTTDIAEGDNEYFTNDRAESAIALAYPNLDTDSNDDFSHAYTDLTGKPDLNVYRTISNSYSISEVDARMTTETTSRQTNDSGQQAQIDNLENRAPQNTEGLDIYFTQGWNTFKLPWFVLEGTDQVHPLDVADYNVETVLAGIDTKYRYLAYYNGTDWQTYVQGNPSATSFTTFPTSATQEDFDFHIYMTEGARLTIQIKSTTP